MEIDSVLKLSFNLLHSSSPDSAEKIRNCLDEIIKTRFGSSKMLINTLNKKIILEENFVSGDATKTADEVKSNTIAKASYSLNSSDAISIASEEENLTEFGDLACVLCGAMVVVAGNRLVECSECHSLYHQECHKPSISDQDANAEDNLWYCYNCKNKYLPENMFTELATNESEDKSQFISSPDMLLSCYSMDVNNSSTEMITAKANSNEVINKVPTTQQSSTSTTASEKRSHSKKKSKHQDLKRKK